jgi:glucose-1-phosphate thymidylyltransferase
LRGVILAGGSGTRLDPLTRVANKHLLPVYDRPMIFFAIEQLRSCGIDHVIIVTGRDHLESFRRLLGDGRAFGLEELLYAAQDRPGGIAEALGLARGSADTQQLAVLLADNVFERSQATVAARARGEPDRAHLVLAKVDDPRPYGVASFEDDRLVRVVEKPDRPPSSLIVTGLYFFPSGVFEVVDRMRPSARGELEITDVVNDYVEREAASYDVATGYWIDCGESFETLRRSAELVATRGANKND